MRCMAPRIAAIAFLAASVQAHSAPAPGAEITVHVARAGDTFTVEADWTVAASADAVWDVLTDFDRMALIVSSVDASRIINRDGNRFEVEQKSHGDVGLLRISRDSLRQVELLPKREIRSRLLKGDLKSSDFTTRIAEEAGGAKVSVRAHSLPPRWRAPSSRSRPFRRRRSVPTRNYARKSCAERHMNLRPPVCLRRPVRRDEN